MNSSDHAYATLRTRILAGDIPPGAVLKERDLCEELNISRTPVREALRRLSADGLAEVRPRRSIVVTSFPDNEIAEIFELGIVLESFVAGIAAEKATSADVARLRDLVDALENLLATEESPDTAEYIRLDQAFHEEIARIARNPRIAQILRQTISIPVLANVFERYDPADFAISIAQHGTILRAIESGDSDWAKSAMGTHIRTGRATQRKRKSG